MTLLKKESKPNKKGVRSIGILCLLFCLISISSCKFNSEYQNEGAEYLQGVWVQDSIPYQDQLNSYALHEIKFTCDSMYVKMDVFQKTKTLADSCFNEGNWEEYAKAVYVVRGDSLIVDGLYAKDNWKQKVSGCYRIGQYIPRFKIVHSSSDSLVLENRYDQNKIILRKTEEITCVPRKRFE